MSSEATLTIVGNLVKDPELRFLPSGQAVVNFTIARTPSKFNRETKQWEKGEAVFMPCTAWAELAQNIANSLVKGSNVIVTGELRARSYDTREGEKRTVLEVNVDTIGASLAYATVAITKNPSRGGAQSGGHTNNAHASTPSNASSAPVDDEPPF